MESTHHTSVEELDHVAVLAEHRIDELEAELVLARTRARTARSAVAGSPAVERPAWLRCADLESDWDVRNAAQLAA
jgi:hypothetical protein